MKTREWVFFWFALLLFGLTGCQKQVDDTTEPPSSLETESDVAITVSQKMLEYHLSTIGSGSSSLLLETENGYFTAYVPRTTVAVAGNYKWEEYKIKELNDVGTTKDPSKEEGCYLYYADKGTLEWEKVCSNPDCPHNNWYCEAYLGQSTVSIGLYEDHIYFTSFEYVGQNELGLYRMELNGAGRELVTILPYEEGWHTGGLYHNAYYFYYMYHLNEENGTVTEKLYQYSLKEGGTPELILEEDEAQDLSAYRMYPMGDKLYLMRHSKDRESYRLSCLDLRTGEMETVLETCPAGYFRPEETGCYFSIKHDGMYYLDWETKTRTLLCSMSEEEMGVAYPDEKYFYSSLAVWEEANVGQKLYIYDREGNLVQELEYPIRHIYEEAGILVSDEERAEKGLPSYNLTLYYWGSTEDKVLFSEDYTMDIPVWYLEKDKIGTEELEWKRFVMELMEIYTEECLDKLK